MEIIKIPLPFGREHLEPSKAVVHAIAEFVVKDGRAYHAIEWLRKKELSYHALVTPSGTIIRCREDSQVAWHAKAHGHNFKALGIAFLVPGAYNYSRFLETIKNPYLLPKQYIAGMQFCKNEWVDKLGILHFTQHSKIDPENKTDPGLGFPWTRFLGDIGLIYKEKKNA
jgi:N-acetyl-anhydromuramyl-L-alanine amidase AmpD